MLHFLKTRTSKKDLYVGYARENVTPKEPIGLPGFANTDHRLSTEVRDDICVTCLAFSEDKDTVLMYSIDTLYMEARTMGKIRKELHKKTGIPENRIFVCATHTHSGPAYYYEGYFKRVFLPGLVKAAKRALADRSSATIYGTKAETEHTLSSLRHFITTEGEYVGSKGIWDKNIHAMVARCARETDHEMTLIKFVRERRKNICLINWQCHPCSANEADTYLSADFIAPIRKKVEAETGMDCIYFTGASGDVIRGYRVPPEERIFNGHEEFGAILGDIALDAINGDWTKIEGNGIRTVQNRFEYTTNRKGIERLADAIKVRDRAELLGSYECREVNDFAKELGFASARECATIVANSKKPEKAPIELNALYVGGLAFATVPYEMFAENGMFIKKHSPYQFTIINQLTNDYLHYFPVREAYEAKNIYEAKTADFAIGVAEASADQLVSMLKSL